MVKRKQQADQPHNLKRFKGIIGRFTREHADEEDERSFQSAKKTPSRKDKRKEMRKLKKMQKNAFIQRKPMPTVESLQKVKESQEDAETGKKKAAQKRRKKRDARRRKRHAKKQLTEKQDDEIKNANHEDDREIRRCEKLLRLNKRKSKTISLGFKNDGLDFVLEAVEPECLKLLYETGGEEKGDLEAGPLALTAGDLDLASDEELGSDIEDDEDDDESDTAGSDSDDEPEEISQMTKSQAQSSDKERLVEEILTQIKSKKKDAKEKGQTEKEEGGKDGKKGEKRVTFVDEMEECGEAGDKGQENVFDEMEGMEVEENSDLDLEGSDRDTDLGDSGDEDTKSEEEEEGVSDESDDDLEAETKSGRGSKSKGESEEDSKELKIKEDSNASESISEEVDIVGSKSKTENESKSESDGREPTNRDDSMSESDSNESDSPEEGDDKESGLKEDIYGRLRDKEGNIVERNASKTKPGGAYVPPGKRLALAKNFDEKRRLEMERLKKQLKGLINRLSESNMQPISSQIEDIFLGNSRAESTESLIEIILAACIAPHQIPERLITEHAMLLAILHGNIGSEVGAMFLQSVAHKFQLLCNHGDRYGDGKEMDNILVLLSQLYNFKMVHSVLMFDILKKLAATFNEKDIELILLMLRSVGFGLRKDDPAALKELIIDVQNKAAGAETDDKFEDQSRVKFMLETIIHIKNNNMRKIPNYDPTHMEHLRKLLRNYITKGGLGDGQLRISLQDLLLAEERGKWWLVGSAWQGRELQPTQLGGDRSSASSIGGVSAQILELARKQRMNTDVRRNIFCVIMTSEDYVDAFEKLLRLGLKNQSEREIVHVVVDMCLQEKVYNPFYAYLMQKFCEYDRRFQMTLQFNTWDRLKELLTYKQYKVLNLASLLAHLIATKAMSLSIFKVVEFGDLDKSKVFLMKQTLHKLLLDYPDYITTEVFSRISAFPKLSTLREGLRLFMRHFLLRTSKNQDVKAAESLKERVGVAEKGLMSQDTKMRM